jgi:hypothetical protein
MQSVSGALAGPASLANAIVRGLAKTMWRTTHGTVTLGALLLAACSSAPSLDRAEELASKTVVASSPEDADACLISTTGADRNGVRLPKAAVKAIKAELKDRRVDCSAHMPASVADSGTGGAASPSASFDNVPEQSRQEAD